MILTVPYLSRNNMEQVHYMKRSIVCHNGSSRQKRVSSVTKSLYLSTALDEIRAKGTLMIQITMLERVMFYWYILTWNTGTAKYKLWCVLLNGIFPLLIYVYNLTSYLPISIEMEEEARKIIISAHVLLHLCFVLFACEEYFWNFLKFCFLKIRRMSL